MKAILKHLWILILLIITTSGILLMSDASHRESASKYSQTQPSIAIIQYASTPVLDEHVRGVIDELKHQGVLKENQKNLRVLNAQGDNSLAASIAREAVEGPYEILISSSTMSLQSVAGANRNTRKPHIFGAVTDPYGTGVGITGTKPEDHPSYLAGIGTFQPVTELFQVAKELCPDLRRVGVLWNPSEQCSAACLEKARVICEELNIELVEVTANNAAEVSEALRSLLGKNVEAIWIGGDTVAIAAAQFIIKKSGESGIPVITNDPNDTEQGALIGLGADYYSVGRYTGALAAEIIRGRSPSTVAIKNVIKQKLCVNRPLFNTYRNWEMTPSIQEQVNAALRNQPQEPEPGKVYTVGLCYYVPSPGFDLAIDGFRSRMAEKGFIEGKNLRLDIQHANGDMSMLPQVTQALLQKQPEVFVPFSTPCLGSAIALGKNQNIVFGIVSAPLKAGAGVSFENHKPNVTGVVQTMPAPELFDYIKELLPAARRIGVLYNPAEANSVKELEDLKAIFRTQNLELKATSVSSSGEVSEGIQGLLAQQIDAVFLLADNTVVSGIPAIVNACRSVNMPIFCEDYGVMTSDIFMSCGPGMQLDGAQTADLVIRVLLGESPEAIPLEPSQRNEVVFDLGAAAKNGIEIPVATLKKASSYLNLGQKYRRPLRISMINFVHSPGLDAAEKGVLEALKQCGIKSGSDYQLSRFNAQGDNSMLSQQIKAALSNNPDLVITLTTPVMMAAAKQIQQTPVVFTVASNPADLGFRPGEFPSNFCGIYEALSAEPLLQMIQKQNPRLQKIGLLYDAVQPNAVLAATALKDAVQNARLDYVELTVSGVSELNMATRSLIQQGAEAIALGSDNLTSSGFPAIIKAAKALDVPVYATDPDLLKQGATGAVGCDYYSWGFQAGEMAAGVLAGIPPEQQGIEAQTKKIQDESSN